MMREKIMPAFLGMHPAKLQRYVEQAVFGGKFDDGLMQRFQLLVWPDIPKERVDIDLDQKTAFPPMKKNGSSRWVP